jgi:hypothetical protein
MISFDEIKKYLPQYLSPESQNILFEDLKKFPDNIDQRLYSTRLIDHELIYQGDGIDGLPVCNFPSTDTRELPVIVFSNTCDVNPANARFFDSRIVYSPIFQLEKYKKMLIDEFVTTHKHTIDAINNHIEAVKKQLVTQILFLPKGGRLQNDSIVFLDRVNNYPLGKVHVEDVKRKKIFVLSNYGLYIFLIKLSIHFTRIQENVDRLIG